MHKTERPKANMNWWIKTDKNMGVPLVYWEWIPYPSLNPNGAEWGEGGGCQENPSSSWRTSKRLNYKMLSNQTNHKGGWGSQAKWTINSSTKCNMLVSFPAQ